MKEEILNYYKVVAKCGHVGKRKYIPIQFPIMAQSGKEAAKLARNKPRVKHNHNDAILKVEKITLEDYLELKKINESNTYLNCHSRKEQKEKCDLTDKLIDDPHYLKKQSKKRNRRDKTEYIQKKYKLIEQNIREEIKNEYYY